MHFSMTFVDGHEGGVVPWIDSRIVDETGWSVSLPWITALGAIKGPCCFCKIELVWRRREEEGALDCVQDAEIYLNQRWLRG
jgi:hypothetical protein